MLKKVFKCSCIEPSGRPVMLAILETISVLMLSEKLFWSCCPAILLAKMKTRSSLYYSDCHAFKSMEDIAEIQKRKLQNVLVNVDTSLKLPAGTYFSGWRGQWRIDTFLWSDNQIHELCEKRQLKIVKIVEYLTKVLSEYPHDQPNFCGGLPIRPPSKMTVRRFYRQTVVLILNYLRKFNILAVKYHWSLIIYNKLEICFSFAFSDKCNACGSYHMHFLLESNFCNGTCVKEFVKHAKAHKL